MENEELEQMISDEQTDEGMEITPEVAAEILDEINEINQELAESEEQENE